jgi:histidinol-phosphate aminotransferase
MKKLIKDNILTIENYEPGLPIEILQQKLGLKGEISKLASNENPLGPSPLAVRAIQSCVMDGHLYPDTTCHLLKDKLSEHLKVSKEHLYVGNGTTELIYLIGIAFLNEGDGYIMSESSFIMGKIIAQIMSADLIQVPLKDYRHDLDSIQNAVTPGTKIIYLDNPMNPIGSTVSRGEIAKFMEAIPEDIIVVFDEAYYEYVKREDFPDSLSYIRDGRNVIVLRTFSKMFGLAGLRIGYCAAHEEFIKAFKRISPPFSVNRLAQAGAKAALDDEDHIRQSKEVNERGKKYLCEQLKELSVFHIPSETNFVTIDTGADAVRIAEELQKKGVIVRPLTMYGKPTFVRVTVGTLPQNQRFMEAFRPIYQSSA